ncbi:hypothetical protein LO763_01470 [Glycomyces sp. A-F 0318]|uniref:hypothetical protein n=1 Tax=Glycomyces amatae TaxID=2881355 RepID=UPI001E4EF3D9|nr:hypothetical protein [Glycomyces amatae]MCD0442294.1 hypothetical protein [Glycomyces amatae]
MDEAEAAQFADPPRKWARVGAMAGSWAVVLALGAWVAPGFAAGGSDEEGDSRDEPASTANNAAWRYLRYGSNEDADRAEASLCDDASPELTPADLDTIRQAYADELGGITRVDLETGDPVQSSDGIMVAGTVSYIYQGTQRHEDFVVTVQENDGSFCVSNATQPDDEADQPSASEGTESAVDPKTVAADFLRAVVVERNPQAAIAMQCDSYSGITAQDLDAAIADWTATNGATTGYLNSLDSAEGPMVFEAEIKLDGDLKIETFAFQLAVQGDCVESLEGGDGLVKA